MTKLAFIDVAAHAFTAGFRGEPHAIVVALSQPESNRVPTAHNGSDPNGGSFGLLQINAVHLNPGGTLEGWTTDDLFDPAKNLVAAFRVWKANGESFQPWGAFTTGLHTASLDAAKVALDACARIRQRDVRVAQYKAERDRIGVLHDALKLETQILQGKIAAAQQALA